MNPVFSATHLSFIWNYFDELHNVYSWLIRFPNEAALSEFQAVFGECMYESLNKLSWAKVSVCTPSRLLFGSYVELSALVADYFVLFAIFFL